ncbi:MAG: hypothetical protein HY922_03370 [Elusimicrobia bacterium]|nr:hypothetical protein [Elusimicrobiota bacterium]
MGTESNSQVVFEYTDSAGKAHRVNSIDQVPKAHIKSMIAYGPEAGAQLQQEQAQPAASAFMIPSQGRLIAAGVLALLLVFLWKKFDSFIIRLLLIAVILFALFSWGFERLAEKSVSPAPAAQSAPAPQPGN